MNNDKGYDAISTGLAESGAKSVTTGPAEPGLNEMVLFWASFLTLIAAGIGFSVRGAILGDWSKQFGFTQGELGTITGGGLVGFGLTIIVFSFIADRVGYGWLMVIAFLFHASSAVVTLGAGWVFRGYGKEATYWTLYVGAFLFSLGNGTCEAVINPLTATLFPRNKTHWLNILHAGWPGGLVLGALIALGLSAAGVGWEVQMGIFLVPTLAYGVLMVGRGFPRSEARASGVTMPQMMKELGLLGAAVVVALLGLWFSEVAGAFGLPPVLGWGLAVLLLIAFGAASQFAIGHWMLAMLLVLHAMVGYVELGTDSWITNITGTIMANKQFGLLLFIWTSSLMFILRFFAGPIVHRISPLGLLFCSAVLGSTGLLLLGAPFNTFIGTCVLAATVYGFGKTFFWPTMLGVVSERYPRGGALTLGMIGGVGMLSAGLLGGPGIGYKQDYFAVRKLSDHPNTYDRYKAQSVKKEDGKVVKGPDGWPVMVDDQKGFLEFTGLFPKITGLGGDKVAILLGDPGKDNGMGKLLEEDVKNFTAKGGKLEDNENLNLLNHWWETQGLPNAETDKPRVAEARLYGGKMALTWTAAVPATMAVGYLLLILYFRLIGGYQAKVLTGHAAEDERFTGGTVGPGEG
jgi:MFS family permease